MTPFLSFIILIHFVWMSVVKAIPYYDVVRDNAFGAHAKTSGRLSPTSREFYNNSEQARMDMEQACFSGDQLSYDEAFARHNTWEQIYDERFEHTQGHRLLANDPKRVTKQAGYILGGIFRR